MVAVMTTASTLNKVESITPKLFPMKAKASSACPLGIMPDHDDERNEQLGFHYIEMT